MFVYVLSRFLFYIEVTNRRDEIHVWQLAQTAQLECIVASAASTDARERPADSQLINWISMHLTVLVILL